MRLQVRALIALFLTAFPVTSAFAFERDGRAFSIYWGQGVDSDLLKMPGDLLRGDLVFESSYLIAASYIEPVSTPAPVQTVFDWLRVPGTSTAVEGIVVKHYGLQRNWEVNLAYLLRFRGWDLGPVSAKPGVGIGLSYALGRPSFEDGPIDDPERRYRFQSYQAYEIEWGLARQPGVSLFTRVHHRSGIYGLIAPRRVGSNFVTVGLRFHQW